MTYEATCTGITVLEGVEIDITVSGNEKKAEKAMMELKEHTGRIQAAFEQEQPPLEFERAPPEYLPLMTVDWDLVFSDE